MTVAPLPSSRSAPVDFDQLAVDAARRLQKRPVRGSWGVVGTALLASITFGLFPLFAWPAMFQEYVAEQTSALRKLAQWAQRRGRDRRSADRIAEAVEQTAVGPATGLWSAMIGVFIAVLLATQLRPPYGSMDALIGITYDYGHSYPGTWSSMTSAGAVGLKDFYVHRTWVLALSAAYVLLWLRVRSHAQAVQRCIQRINVVVTERGLRPIRLPRHAQGAFAPAWVLLAIVLAMYGAWWGIPMAIAGIAQRRYANGAGLLLRKELVLRLRQILAVQPAMPAPDNLARCGNSVCLAPLRPAARFCPRCGNSVDRVIEPVEE